MPHLTLFGHGSTWLYLGGIYLILMVLVGLLNYALHSVEDRVRERRERRGEK